MTPYNIKGRSGYAWVQKCLQQKAMDEAANPNANYGTLLEPTEGDLLLFAQACEVSLRYADGRWVARLDEHETEAALPLMAVWHLYFKAIEKPPQGVWCRSLGHECQHLVFPDGTTHCGASNPLGGQWIPADNDNDQGYGHRCYRCIGRQRAIEAQREKALAAAQAPAEDPD